MLNFFKYTLYVLFGLFLLLAVIHVLTPQSVHDARRAEASKRDKENIQHCINKGYMYLPGEGCVSYGEYRQAVQEFERAQANRGLK